MDLKAAEARKAAQEQMAGRAYPVSQSMEFLNDTTLSKLV